MPFTVAWDFLKSIVEQTTPQSLSDLSGLSEGVIRNYNRIPGMTEQHHTGATPTYYNQMLTAQQEREKMIPGAVNAMNTIGVSRALKDIPEVQMMEGPKRNIVTARNPKGMPQMANRLLNQGEGRVIVQPPPVPKPEKGTFAGIMSRLKGGNPL